MLILDLAKRGGWVVSVTNWPRFNTPHPQHRWLGGPHSRTCLRHWKSNPLTLQKIEPRSSSPCTDTVLAELPRLLAYLLCNENRNGAFDTHTHAKSENIYSGLEWQGKEVLNYPVLSGTRVSKFTDNGTEQSGTRRQFQQHVYCDWKLLTTTMQLPGFDMAQNERDVTVTAKKGCLWEPSLANNVRRTAD